MREIATSLQDRQPRTRLPSLLSIPLALGFWTVSAAWGEVDEQPIEEVFQTELVYPQEEGEFQLTLAPQWQSGSEEDRFQSRISLEYGITDAFQVGLEWDFFTRLESEAGERVEGIGDLEVGFKLARMDPAGKLHFAFGLEVGLPLAEVDDDLGEGLLEVEPFVVIARDFPELRDLQLFAQIGVGLVARVEDAQDPDEEEPEAHELGVNLGLFLPAGPVVLTAELNWSTNTWNHDGEDNELYLTAGLVRPLADDWEFGLAVPIGLNTGADDYRLIGMLTAEF